METDDKKDVLQILKSRLPDLKRRYGIRKLGLYGSFSTGSATQDSDVDLVVELGRPLGFEFAAMVEDLESSLGRKVDVTTSETLEFCSRGDSRHRRIVDGILSHLRYLDE